LDSILTQLDYYRGATSPESQCGYIRQIIDDSDQLFTNLTGLSLTFADAQDKGLPIPIHAPQYIPLVATLLPIHMGTLREQYRMYEACSLAQDTALSALKTAAGQYAKAINNAYSGVPADSDNNQPNVIGLKDWSTNQPSPYFYHPVTNTACPATAFLDDDLTAYFTNTLLEAPTTISIRFCQKSTSDYGTFASLNDQLISFLTSHWQTAFAATVFPFTKLHQFLPGSANQDQCVQVVDDLNTIKLGPLSTLTGEFRSANNGFGGNAYYERHFQAPVTEPNSGITKVLGYTDQYNTLVGLQFFYGDTAGQISGGTKGQVHEFDVPSGATIDSVDAEFSYGYMTGVAFTLSDGTPSGLIGSKSDLASQSSYTWTSDKLYTLQRVELSPTVTGQPELLVGPGMNLNLAFNPAAPGCTSASQN
jgi:hypothetical protein